jgi:hypothetical protein
MLSPSLTGAAETIIARPAQKKPMKTANNKRVLSNFLFITKIVSFDVIDRCDRKVWYSYYIIGLLVGIVTFRPIRHGDLDQNHPEKLDVIALDIRSGKPPKSTSIID